MDRVHTYPPRHDGNLRGLQFSDGATRLRQGLLPQNGDDLYLLEEVQSQPGRQVYAVDLLRDYWNLQTANEYVHRFHCFLTTHDLL